MKSTIGLALASGLSLLIGGCAAGSATSGGPAAGGSSGQSVASTGGEIRNFNLEVKCPGVHYMKTHGKSDEDITSQLQMDKSEIDACEAWAAAQPKGYVPPPATGTTAQAGGSPTAPAPAKPQ